jgi:hypothetical protein
LLHEGQGFHFSEAGKDMLAMVRAWKRAGV